jgi:hypothetical protein
MQARLCSVLRPTFGNRVHLSQHRNGPTKPVLTGRPGLADDATGTTISTDHQLDARANSLPFEPGWNRFYVLPRAELLGELSDALDAVRRDEDCDFAQLLSG